MDPDVPCGQQLHPAQRRSGPAAAVVTTGVPGHRRTALALEGTVAKDVPACYPHPVHAMFRAL